MKQLIENEQIYAFDVDDTLVMWSGDYMKPGEGRIEIRDPYDGALVYLVPHQRHIKLARQMKGRGRHVIVWSAGGALWADAVVKALELEDVVDQVMTKPAGYVDDLLVQEWMPKRIYLTQDEEDEADEQQ